VSVKVRKGEGPKVIPHTFLATMKSGHKGVYIRREARKGPKAAVRSVASVVSSLAGVRISGAEAAQIFGKRKHGLPIDELYGPTVVGIITGKPGTKEAIEQFASDDLDRQFDSQIKRFLAGRRADAE
jgi:hypothetical protein